MIRAIVLGEKEKVEALCRAFPEMINEADPLGISPLEMAVAHDNPEIVKILLDQGGQGERAVQMTCDDSDIGADILDLLLGKGFSVSTEDAIRVILRLRKKKAIDEWLPKLQVIFKYPRSDLPILQEAAACSRAIPAVRLLGGEALRNFVKGKFRFWDKVLRYNILARPSYESYSRHDIKKFILELATKEEFRGEDLLKIAGDEETRNMVEEIILKNDLGNVLRKA